MTQSASQEYKLPPSYAQKGNLREGSLTRHLVRLTLPMIWGIAVIISFQLVDMYFIARLGTDALAAVSFTFPVTYAILSLTIAMGIAMSSVVARRIGEGDQDGLCRIVTHGIILTCGVAAVISLVGITLHDPLFRLMGAPDDFIPLIHDYMLIWFAGSAVISLPMVGNSALRASGDTTVPAIIMTVAALVNVILDPILIFGLFGFPRMEIQGAALATVIGNSCAAIAGLYILARHKHYLKFKWIKDLTAFGDTAKKLLVIAVPVGLTQSIQPMVNAVVIALLAAISKEAVAAYGVVLRVEAFAFIVLMALATGMAPVIGQNFGAKKFDRVYQTLKLVIRFNVQWSLLLALVLGLYGADIARLFSDDSEVVMIAQLFFWVVPFTYAFSNLVTGWSSAFNAMGQPKRSFIMIVTKLVVLMLPAIYIGAKFGGMYGLFGAMALVNITAGLFFHFWSWHNVKKDCPASAA
ncbi:MAG: MATE family efflux transporter [Pseudobdellovibrionaceae bacterium]